MKKLLTYCSLFILTGCLTDSGTTVSRVNTSKTTTGTNSGSKTNTRKNETTTTSTLGALSNIKSIENLVTTENNNRIINAFKKYNEGQSAEDKKVSADKTNIAQATEYLKQAKIGNINISEMITAIDTLVAKYYEYSPKKLSYDTLSKYSLELQGNKDETAYAEYLVNNVNQSIITKKKDDFTGTDTQSATAQYIAYVQKTYFDKIKTDATFTSSVTSDYAGKDYTADNYIGLMTALNTKKGELKTNTSALESEIKTNLKKLDPTVNEIPLTIESVISYWQKQLKILNVIKDVSYLSSSTIDSNDMKTNVLGNDITVGYTYNKALNDYTLDLKKNEYTVSFKATDFKKDANHLSYTATNKRDDEVVENSAVFMTNLKKYLSDGGKTSDEIKARAEYAIKLFKAIKSEADRKDGDTTVYANDAQKTEFLNLTNGFVSNINNLTDSSSEDYKNFNIALIILQSKGMTPEDFGLKKTVSTTDTVYLGGNYAGLSFSDFGVWNISSSNTYTGNKTLLNYLKDTVAKDTSSSENYSFYSGLDSLKQRTLKDESMGDKEIVFTGNTIGYGTLTGKAEADTQKVNLNGTAKLNVTARDANAYLTLTFPKWYGFRINGINLQNKDGFSKEFTGNTSEAYINSSCTSCGWFKSDENGSIKLTGSVNGAQYGLEENTPTEAVGVYKITSSDVDTEKYTDIKIEGAFGVKKQ